MNIYGEWKVQIREVAASFEKEVFIWRRVPQGVEVISSDGTVHIEQEGEATKAKPFRFSPEMLQAIADSLAKSGYKPEQGYSTGKLEAMERHLEDMRALVFKGST